MASGLVQGVFFRATCVRLARELALVGWVRNTTDGRVEAVFEGSNEAVDRIIAWCREGTPSAHVTWTCAVPAICSARTRPDTSA